MLVILKRIRRGDHHLPSDCFKYLVFNNMVSFVLFFLSFCGCFVNMKTHLFVVCCRKEGKVLDGGNDVFRNGVRERFVIPSLTRSTTKRLIMTSFSLKSLRYFVGYREDNLIDEAHHCLLYC